MHAHVKVLSVKRRGAQGLMGREVDERKASAR